MALYIGLMSGTSLDGLDGVLAEIGADGRTRPLAHHHLPFPAELRERWLRLNSPGDDELHQGAEAANALAEAGAQVVAALLSRAGVGARQVRAIGSHGQTVRHRPDARAASGGYTIQLDNPALLAERCGIDVVADFRRADLAAGGQGAPLVPAFHAAHFGRAGMAQALLNLGGIANLTLLHADGLVEGFDCGPANVLLDGWHARHHPGASFDDGGRWAASGRVDEPLAQTLLAEPYFARLPPKSTGRDLFSLAWLDAALARDGRALAPADVQATLSDLSARAAADTLRRHAPATVRLLACGGGARNVDLMRRLHERLAPQTALASTADEGLDVSQVEAAAFAWLAHRHVERLPGNLPAVTGARRARVLGALYPAA